jgi:glutamyl-tRNA synthetase
LFDEGVHNGGPYAPYRQSERKEIYQAFAAELVSKGHAYYAFDTPSELEEVRNEFEWQKLVFNYDASIRLRMKNSLSLPSEEVKRRLSSGGPYVIRFRIPEKETLVFHDLIRGEISVNTDLLDDKVLFKSDGMPTYHLANVVDDHLMKITHVIRGEEWLPSLPLHVLLYRSFNWDPPLFAHLPLILKPEGSGKLSKRDGDRLGFPVFPLEWKDPFTGEVSSGYRESGYFPEAVINMVALLGWNPGTDQEIFSMDELSGAFSLERVGRSGARFDPAKARWFNHQYLVRRNSAELTGLFTKELSSRGIVADESYIARVVELVKERSDFVSGFWAHAFFFFEKPLAYDQEIIRKRWKEGMPDMLDDLSRSIGEIIPFQAGTIREFLDKFAADHHSPAGSLMNSLRLCLAGGSYGPDLAIICEMLGPEEVVTRIRKALAEIKMPQ